MIDNILNLIFPPKCIFCSEVIKSHRKIHVCSNCFLNIPFMDDINFDGNKFKGKYFDGVICVSHYSGIIKNALQRNKFSDKPSYYRTFSGLLAERIIKASDGIFFDFIVSVPMHPVKEKARGYNQSFLIAKGLSKELNKPIKTNVLRKIRNTESQSSLARVDREKNLIDAFEVCDVQAVCGKAILLVDDILTTGSTLDECSRVLKEAGASKIIAGVIATGRQDV